MVRFENFFILTRFFLLEQNVFVLTFAFALLTACLMSLFGLSPTPSKTDSGMQDSTCNAMKTLKTSKPLLKDTTNLAYCDTSLSEDPRLEPEPTKTITKSVMSMSLQSSTTELVNAQSCNIGISRLETVIILFRGTEICLCPDGAITISKSSPRLMLPTVCYLKWGRSQRTKRVLDKGTLFLVHIHYDLLTRSV